MKYIKQFENLLDNLNKLSDEYKNYAGKYCIIEYTKDGANQIYLIKFIGIVLNGYFARMEILDYDDFYKGYNVHPQDAVHLSDFSILKVFDDMKDAKNELEFIENAKKYNL